MLEFHYCMGGTEKAQFCSLPFDFSTCDQEDALDEGIPTEIWMYPKLTAKVVIYGVWGSSGL